MYTYLIYFVQEARWTVLIHDISWNVFIIFFSMHLKSMYAPSFVGWLRDSNSRLLTAPSCLFAIMLKNIFYYFVWSLRNYWSLYYEQFWGKILSPNFFKICVDCLIWCKVWLTQVKETWNGLLFTGKCLFCSQKVLLFVILDLYTFTMTVFSIKIFTCIYIW